LKRDGPIYINCAGETATNGGFVQCNAVAASVLGIAAGNVGEIVPVIVSLLRITVTVLAMVTPPLFKKVIVLRPVTAMPPNNAGSPVPLAVPSLMGLKGQRTPGLLLISGRFETVKREYVVSWH
jgi:hypothetical protein